MCCEGKRGFRGVRAAGVGGIAGTLAAAVFLVGCQGPGAMTNADHLDGGLIVVLPGIDGRTPHSESICRALAARRPDMAVELYDWTAPLGAIYNQVAVERNRSVAERLATRILAYRKAHADRPVTLVGHSGGTAIAVWAAENLPADQPVDGIVLLASSLSPEYDLSRALSRSAGGIVSFYSDRDAALLGVGTSLVGTMDGRHCEAAGKVGFREGDYPCEALVQIAWRPAMAETGYDGGHLSCTAEEFVAKYVGPWVRAPLASRGTVAAGPNRAPTPEVVSADR